MFNRSQEITDLLIPFLALHFPTLSLRHLASALMRIDPMYISVSVCFLLLLLHASSGLSKQFIFIIISIIDLPIGWSYSHQNLSSSIFPISFFLGLNSSILLSSSFPSYASLFLFISNLSSLVESVVWPGSLPCSHF